MQAVFLNDKTYEIVYPAAQKVNKKSLYGGMNESIESGHKIWITQYLRSCGGIFPRLAFAAGEEENVDFIPDREYTFCTKRAGKQIYFIPENFNMHLVGDTEFFYQKDGIEGSIHVRIASMLDDDTYEEIRRDLTAVSIRLLYKSKEDKINRRIRQEYLSEYDLEIRQLEHSIKELERLLGALDKDPMTDMTSRSAGKNFNRVKHLDANVIMDHYVLKKPKVRTRVHEKTLNTYENRKIFAFLKLLEKRLRELAEEIERNRDSAEYPREKETEIIGRKSCFDELQRTIHELQKRLQNIYALDMFHIEPFRMQKVYPLKASNLFVNHERYRKIFHQMQSYRDVGELLEEGMRPEYKSVHRSPDLYEVWCYFKILEILTLEKGYRVDRISWPGKMGRPFSFEVWSDGDHRRLLGRIRDHIDGDRERDSIKSLEGLVIHLADGEKDIYLGYNCTFRGKAVARADVREDKSAKCSTDRLRPDIFLILNKEIFFACDAKYKIYSEEFMGIQEWYTDLFECAAYKYIYRLDLGDALVKGTEQSTILSVKERFAGADRLKDTLKNGGACILTPAIADSEEPAKYNGYMISEKYKTFLEYMKEGKVNRDSKGHEILDPAEYNVRLKKEIINTKGDMSDYEYRVASVRFLPGQYSGFKLLFLEALKYGQAHFIEEI